MDATTALNTLEHLLHRIAPEADLRTVGEEEPLSEALDLDSMDFLNLMTALHDETGIDVPERDYPKVSTLRSFVEYLSTAA